MRKIPSILLIGVGRWGQNHLRVWLRLQAQGLCRFAGVWDASAERRRSVAEEFGVRTFSDESAVPEADAVDIAVPTYNHVEIAKRALEAGRDVMVEKPMTGTVAQAEELARIAGGGGRVCMVGHLFRYNPAVEYVKRAVEEGEIGKIRFLRGRFMGFRFKEHDAGILATTSIHFLYLSNYFIGKRPKAVRARAHYLLDSKLDDLCTVHLEYGPEFSIIESDYFTPGKWRTFDIIGTQGSILVDVLNQKVELHRKKHVWVGERFETYDGGVHVPTIEFEEPLELELTHFLSAVRDRTEPLTGVGDGLDVLKTIAAAYQSSQQDTTIQL